MGRLDLTYLTQAEFTQINCGGFIQDQNKNVVSTGYNKYQKPISKLPELVQCAEMLFDMTLDKPNSIIHKMVFDLLNELKEEK